MKDNEGKGYLNKWKKDNVCWEREKVKEGEESNKGLSTGHQCEKAMPVWIRISGVTCP